MKNEFNKVRKFQKGKVNEEKCLQLLNNLAELDHENNSKGINFYKKIDLIETIYFLYKEVEKLEYLLNSNRLKYVDELSQILKKKLKEK